MSHEGKMRRGREESERGLVNADTKYYQEQVKEGNENPEVTAAEVEEKKKD